MSNKWYLSIFILGLSVSILYAQEVQKEVITENKTPSPKEEFAETLHEIVIEGKPLPYKATAGNLLLRDEKDHPKASIFFISYTKEGVESACDRPITFCFNGGPGSSSVWLHLGTFGPKRVPVNDKGEALSPYCLVDNDHSILDLTDLVFIDPVSTGYSRAIPFEDSRKYHGVEEDVKSVAEFIRLYITRYNRWSSPKFIAGESYGTTRAAALASYLQDKNYLYLNGLVLISAILDFQCIECSSGNDHPYLMFLPTYTASAWYHRKLTPDLQKNLFTSIQESRDFVNNDYVVALFKGNLLQPQVKDETIQKLARLTGLSPDYIAKSNLRVGPMHFAKELLRNENRTLGRYDSRYTGIDSSSIGEFAEYDPSAVAVFGAFTAAFNQYVHADLKWKQEEAYHILAGLSQHWDFSVATNQYQYLNVADNLRATITKNPQMNVFVANGIYDLATPFFATEYTFNHLGLDASLLDRVTMEYYEAGHMMYLHFPSLVKLKRDLAHFYQKTLDQPLSSKN